MLNHIFRDLFSSNLTRLLGMVVKRWV